MIEEEFCPHKISGQRMANAPECDTCQKWATCYGRQKHKAPEKEGQRPHFWVNGRTLPFFRGNRSR